MAAALHAGALLLLMLCLGGAVAEGDGELSHDGAEQLRRLVQSVPAMPFIVGGTPAPCGRYPYMVSLRSAENVHKCGGILVHKRWVVTAAHCVDPADPSSLGATPILVIGGCTLGDKSNENGKVEVSRPDRAIIHEGWTGNPVEGNDIALLKLSSKSKHIPATLPTASHMLQRGYNLVALGWGSGSEEHLQQAATLNIIKNDVCRGDAVWGDVIIDSMICAYSPQGQDVCSGDSGGPLLEAFSPMGNLSAGRPAVDVAVGITSFGQESRSCSDAERPAVFTRLSSFRLWIDSTIQGKKLPSSAPPTPTEPTPSPPEQKAPPAVPDRQRNQPEEPQNEAPQDGPGDSAEESTSDAPPALPPQGSGPLCEGQGKIITESIPGSYTAIGTNPKGTAPETYRGFVTLSIDEDGFFRQAWLIEETLDYRGQGVLVDDILTVDWGSTFPIVYRVGCNGTLVGTWANGQATETLIPAGCQGEGIQPGDLSASYTVTGTNPASIGALDDVYEGVATVTEESSKLYRINWRVGTGETAAMSSGTFSPEGNTVSVDWGDLERITTVYDWHCQRGILLGTWADGKGTEALAPRVCDRDVGKDLSGTYDAFVVGADGIVQTGEEILEAGVGDEYSLIRTINDRNVTGKGSLKGSAMVVKWSEGPTATFAVDWCGGFLLGVWDDGEGFNVTKEHLVR